MCDLRPAGRKRAWHPLHYGAVYGLVGPLARLANQSLSKASTDMCIAIQIQLIILIFTHHGTNSATLLGNAEVVDVHTPAASSPLQLLIESLFLLFPFPHSSSGLHNGCFG